MMTTEKDKDEDEDDGDENRRSKIKNMNMIKKNTSKIPLQTKVKLSKGFHL